MENRYLLNLDFKSKSFYNINFVQNDIDTSVLEITITNQGLVVDLTGQTIEIAFLKPDNSLVIQDQANGVNILDAINGKFQCILKSNSLSAIGKVSAEVSFSDATGKKLSTAQFTFTVTESLDNGTGVISTSEIPKLDAEIAKIEAEYALDYATWNSEVDNVIAQANNEIALTETARQNAISATNSANTVTGNAITATNNAISAYNSTIVIPKTPVANFAAISSTYPVPQIGWEVVTLDTGNKYRWDGVSTWINNGNVNRGGILVGSSQPSDTSIIWCDINS